MVLGAVIRAETVPTRNIIVTKIETRPRLDTSHPYFLYVLSIVHLSNNTVVSISFLVGLKKLVVEKAVFEIGGQNYIDFISSLNGSCWMEISFIMRTASFVYSRIFK